MTHTKSDKGYVIRLNRGEKIIETLTQFCKNENITSGIFQGIGACQNPTLGYYELSTKQYHWQSIDQMLEIVSLTGNVSIVDSEPFLHIHGVFSDKNFQTFGGHLKEGAVGATCEIFLTELGIKIERDLDESVGLKLLNFT